MLVGWGGSLCTRLAAAAGGGIVAGVAGNPRQQTGPDRPAHRRPPAAGRTAGRMARNASECAL